MSRRNKKNFNDPSKSRVLDDFRFRHYKRWKQSSTIRLSKCKLRELDNRNCYLEENENKISEEEEETSDSVIDIMYNEVLSSQENFFGSTRITEGGNQFEIDPVEPARNIESSMRVKARSKSPCSREELLCFNMMRKETIPRDEYEAKMSPDWHLWEEVMQKEKKTIRDLGTWEEIEDFPPGVNVVKTKWVYDIKYDENGEILRLKARLVAKGYTQKKGVDYNVVYSPATRHVAIRILLAQMAKLRLRGTMVDITGAFLHVEIDNDVYVLLPDGTKVKLLKALYGLHQSSRLFHLSVKAVCTLLKMTQSVADQCTFVLKTEELTAIVMAHVDDFIVATDSEKWRKTFMEELAKAYRVKEKSAVKDMGVIKHFLNIKFHISEEGNIFVSQEAYIEKMISKFLRKKKVQKRSIPISPSAVRSLMDDWEENEKKEVTTRPYKQLLGSLIYIMNVSRPDIAYSVIFMASFNGNATDEHYDILMGVLKYLYTTKTLGILFDGQKKGLTGYCDADFGACKKTRRSRNGNVIFYLGSPVSWCSGKDGVIALSTTESETYGLVRMMKDIMYCKNVVKGLMVEKVPIQLYTDNMGTLSLASHPAVHKRSKHFDIKLHFIREQMNKGDMKIEHVKSQDNPADIFTKALSVVQLERCRERIGLKERPEWGSARDIKTKQEV